MEFTKPRFLLCEGDDDKGFFETLIRTRGLPEFQVCQAAECNERNSGGRGGFRYSLDPGIALFKGFKELRAILIVSDNDKASSFREVQDELTVHGYTAPANPNAIGTLLGKPVAILMIPPDQHGDFEKLCFPEIARKWPKAEQCVDAFMTCTGAKDWTKTSSINKARARSAAVGFHEDDPYKGIGRLFQAGVLETANTCFNSVVEFLRNFDAMVGI